MSGGLWGGVGGGKWRGRGRGGGLRGIYGGEEMGRGEGEKDGRRTSDGMVAGIFGTDPAVAVAVEARHWLLGKEGEGLFED